MRFLLRQRDKGICALCGLDTIALKKEHDAIRKTDRHGYSWNDPEEAKQFRDKYGIPWGRAWSDWWAADHIVPVTEGGGEYTLDNYRTLCIPCHKKVTRELRARLSAKKQTRKAEANDANRSTVCEYRRIEWC